MKARAVALVVGVALPTVLLGAGWLMASLREREALVREQEQLLARTADAVRGAVDESLEELRLREDRRPFYLYNPLYSPPPDEVIALNDPLVASPLASDPDDVRIVGYFQVDPRGAVRTPYAETESDLARSPRARRVVALVTSHRFDALRALAYSPESVANPEQPSPLLAAMTPETLARVELRPDRAEPRPALPRRPRRPQPRPSSPRRSGLGSSSSVAASTTSRTQPAGGTSSSPTAPAEEQSSGVSSAGRGIGSLASNVSSSGTADVNPTDNELAPQGPLTTNLSAWNREVYDDIQQAQAGNADANYRVQQRGRAAPSTRRNTIEWDVVADNSRAPLPRQVRLDSGSSSSSNKRGSSSSSARQSSAPQADQAQVVARKQPGEETQLQEVAQRSGEPARNAARASKSASTWAAPRRRGSARAAVAPPPEPPEKQLATHSQFEVEVDYTPMAWGVFDGVVVLHRVVSHEGTAVVQGVILDRDHLVRRWIPSLVARHVVAATPPEVIDTASGEGGDCAIRRPASNLVEGVELCYSPAALAASTALVRDDTGLEVAALAGLVLIVALAGLAMFRATRRAEELSRQKSAFVSSVSHELRTPLTTIRMHAEMLRDGLVPDAKRDRFHRQLVHESVRLSHLVENVLELSRLEEGRRVLRPQLADLRAAVAGVVAEHRPFVEEKGFTVTGPSEGEPVNVAFDAQAVSQIVINLIDNAVKYGEGPERQVEIDVASEGDVALIVVRDRGRGIPADERDRVFERFHRIRLPDQEHMPGTGIGLSLVRELAKGHGGDAEVVDAPGGGCEVRVIIPVGEPGE